MKKKVFFFIFAALLVLMIVPIINFGLGNLKKAEGKKIWSRSTLYNIDFVVPCLNRLLYQFGISIDPDQVIIGKKGWLYLGDMYAEIVTVGRRGAIQEKTETFRKIGSSMDAWSQLLKSKNVSLFKVMLCPNKGTIYPEFLPDWMRPAAYTAADLLLANVGKGIYVDARPDLKAAKSHFSEPLYYKTDTHWNRLGAWVAFRAFTRDIAQTEKGLNWLSDAEVRVSKVTDSSGKDLADKFLRIADALQDQEVHIAIDGVPPVEVVLYDFWRGTPVVLTGNLAADIKSLERPILMKSKHALNQKKILWLRDSFGNALELFMAVTFSDILKLDYRTTDPALFSLLVDQFKPDYVFITVVERDSGANWFTNRPLAVSHQRPEKFVSMSQGASFKIRDMIKLEKEKTFKISGSNPNVTFKLPKPLHPKDASMLVFELYCAKNNEPFPVKFFWRDESAPFVEDKSVLFTTYPGTTSIDLSQFHLWTEAAAIAGVRLDIKAPDACPEFTMKSFDLGR